MLKCHHRLFPFLLTIFALASYRRLYRSIASEAFEQHRLSILRPWTTDSQSSADALRTHEKVVLGWTLETRKSEDGTYQVQAGWNQKNLQLAGDIDDEELKSRIVNHGEAVTVQLPYFAVESSLASSLWPGSLAAAILCRSPSMMRVLEGSNVLELGSGLGLMGAVASKVASSTRLTDNDDDVLNAVANIFQDQSDVRVERLDWRDENPVPSDMLVDVVLSSDVAYYYYLLRPLMDTVQRHLRKGGNGGALWMCVGQANREAQWQLYHNLRDGCYNQMLDAHEGPWPGSTQNRLFRLELYKWRDPTSATPWELDGVIPMAALVYNAMPNIMEPFSLSDFDHEATLSDEESLYMTF